MKEKTIEWSGLTRNLEKEASYGNKNATKHLTEQKFVPTAEKKKGFFEQNLSIEIHDYKHAHSSGEVAWHELRTTPFKDKNGNVVGALELEIPITERKKIEEELKKSNKN